MRVLVTGTGGAAGWPEPGCRCASCLRAAAEAPRGRSSIVIDDGAVTLGVDQVPSQGPAGGGYVVRAIPGGWEVVSPDGGRLLYPAGPGAVPVPPEDGDRDGDEDEDARPYDIAFVDVLGNPAQLGLLRARGLVTDRTATIAAFADHRVSSLAELNRRCAIWRVGVVADGDRATTELYAQKKTARVLVIGGARSGKSQWAELRVAAEPEVSYIATGPAAEGDQDWAARVAAHRARRPGWWRTVETTDLAGVLATVRGAVLIDGIGTWLAAVMDDCGAWDGATANLAKLDDQIAGLVSAWRRVGGYVVAVSDETGLGVIPETASGRLFRDALGRLNQALAAESEEAELVVAGRVLPLNR